MKLKIREIKVKRNLTNRAAIMLSEYFQSQQIVAKKLEIEPSMLSLLLSGKRKPSIETAAKIENMFDIPCKFWVEEVEILPKTTDKEGQMTIDDSIRKIEEFKKDLEHVVNKHGWDNITNTPDFILANYLYWCLSAYNIAVKDNKEWHEK